MGSTAPTLPLRGFTDLQGRQTLTERHEKGMADALSGQGKTCPWSRKDFKDKGNFFKLLVLAAYINHTSAHLDTFS